MAELRIMIGLPGSGKSTYSNDLREKGWLINSSDALREELFGNEDDQSHNTEIFNTMLRRTVNGLLAGVNTIYDATNVVAKRRANLIKEIRRQVPDVTITAVVIATPYGICLERNCKRERKVPVYVISSMMKRFDMPAKWEGFDRILVYGNERPEYALGMQALIDIADRTPQDNPHHTLTIGHHMRAAADKYREEVKDRDENIAVALAFHDVAKVYCKTFTDRNGNPTDIAHYFGHDHASAYLYLSLFAIANINGELYKDDEEIINLIQHHMAHFNGEKYLAKLEQRYGKEFVDKLAIINKYDMLGK